MSSYAPHWLPSGGSCVHHLAFQLCPLCEQMSSFTQVPPAQGVAHALPPPWELLETTGALEELETTIGALLEEETTICEE